MTVKKHAPSIRQTKGNASNSNIVGQSELIVVTRGSADIRAFGVRESAAAAVVRTLEEALGEEGVSLEPLFGRADSRAAVAESGPGEPSELAGFQTALHRSSSTSTPPA